MCIAPNAAKGISRPSQPAAGSAGGSPAYQPRGFTDALIYAVTKGKHRLNPRSPTGAGSGTTVQGTLGPSPSYTGG